MLIPSPLEAKLYYAGLPSCPVLVARTGATRWEPPTGQEGDQKLKELGPAGNHPILSEAWEGDLPHKIIAFLDSMDVKWTSLDIVSIGNVEEYYIPLIHIAPTILWIGVIPGSLSASDGVVAAFKYRKILEENDITDVEVEIRESVVTRWPDYSQLDPPTPSGGKKKGGKKKGKKKRQ